VDFAGGENDRFLGGTAPALVAGAVGHAECGRPI
jgi:hypothetical protein